MRQSSGRTGTAEIAATSAFSPLRPLTLEPDLGLRSAYGRNANQAAFLERDSKLCFPFKAPP